MAYSPEELKDHVKEVQTYLSGISQTDDRIPPVIPDGVYGPGTINAVRAFQESQGLPVTGEVDRETWERLTKVYEKSITPYTSPRPVAPPLRTEFLIQKGDTGDAVYLVQIMLRDLSIHFSNLPSVDLTGVYDESTANGIREFQKLAALPVTGSVDRSTWDMLTHAYNSKHPYPTQQSILKS